MPHVRCRHCEGRRTLTHHPDTYVRLPRCRRCGKRKGYRVDTWRAKFERGAKARCGCLGYHFPHRRGSGFCDHNPKLTEDDLRRRWEGG